MKKMVGIFLAMSVVLSLFAGFTVSAADKVVEYVTNGDFENTGFADLAASGWKVNGSYEQSTEEAKTGKASLKVYGTKSGYASQVLKLTAGETYSFSGWFNIGTPNLGLGTDAELVFDTDGTAGYSDKTDQYKKLSATATAGDVWTKVTGVFTVPEGAAGTALWLRNGGQNRIVYWDDVSVIWEKYPEILSAAFADCDTTSGWAKSPSSTVIATHEDKDAGRTAISVQPDTAGSVGTAYFSLKSNELKAGKAYRLSFWFKTDAGTNPVPYLKIEHIYALNGDENAGKLTLRIDVADSGFSFLTSDKINLAASDAWKLAPAAKNVWTPYTVCFTVPAALGEENEYTYTRSNLNFGQSASFLTDKTTGDKATVYYDALSRKEDYDEITFFNADGEEITSADAGEEVTVRVHVASSGNAADSEKKAAVLAGTYKEEGNIKRLLDVVTREVARGTRLECGEDAPAAYKNKIMMAASDFVHTFEVGAGEMMNAYLWNGFSGMQPIDMATISAPAADAAE